MGYVAWLVVVHFSQCIMGSIDCREYSNPGLILGNAYKMVSHYRVPYRGYRGGFRQSV